MCICTHIATLLSWNVKGWVPRQTPSYVLTLYLQDIWQIPLKQECIVHCESAYKCFQSIKFLLVFLLMLCKCACKDVRSQREYIEYFFIPPLLLLKYWALRFLVCGHEEWDFLWHLQWNSYSIEWMTIFSTNVGGSEPHFLHWNWNPKSWITWYISETETN